MPDPIDDAALVAAAQAGDRSALDALLRIHYDRAFAVCRQILGNPADAADATQNALISVVRGLDRFDGKAAFGTWVYRIATNAALDEMRRRARRPQLLDDRGGHDEDSPSGRLGDDRRSDSYGAIEDRMLLQPALESLPEDYRVAVVLRDVADLDYAEIAEVLDIPPGTVRSRIARGRAALAQLLGTGDPARDVQGGDHD